jgi:GTPase
MSGTLFDEATIYISSGSGGNGSATFRREKYVPRGGPDGGDGGRGGHVYLVADARLNTLRSFSERERFSAENGGHGGKQKRRGRQGNDLVIAVPPGTVVRTTIDGQEYSLDLERPGQRLLAARGGRGGLGNVHFTTSSRQAPRIAELGEPGQKLRLDLELKMIADVGLIGFPNAGKSTLLSVISAARPRIANYPFTTLQPNLGVVDVGIERFIVADIPGLIENAHQGQGLGFDFLRHIERTRLLLHVVDAAGVDGRDPLGDFHQINEELRLYHPALLERPQFVVLNKLDLPDAQERIAQLQRDLPVPRDRVFSISAATREGLDKLLAVVARHLRDMPVVPRDPVDPDEPELTWPLPEVDPEQYSVEREGDEWRVRGVKIERLVTMTNFAQPEALDRVQRVLSASGIAAALLKAGVQEGDTVAIAQARLTWSDVGWYG